MHLAKLRQLPASFRSPPRWLGQCSGSGNAAPCFNPPRIIQVFDSTCHRREEKWGLVCFRRSEAKVSGGPPWQATRSPWLHTVARSDGTSEGIWKRLLVDLVVAKGLRVCRPQAAHCQKEGHKASGLYWSTWRNIKHLCTHANTTELIAPLEVKFTSLSDLPSGGPLPPLGICAARHPMQVVTTSVHWIKPDKLSGEMWGAAGSPRKPRVTWVQDHRHSIVFVQLPRVSKFLSYFIRDAFNPAHPPPPPSDSAFNPELQSSVGTAGPRRRTAGPQRERKMSRRMAERMTDRMPKETSARMPGWMPE